jgi:GT2 family glycosyltransferase
MDDGPDVGIVIATRDRREGLLATLRRLDGGRPVVVVDNGSRDGTPAAVRATFPAVTVLEPGANLGAAARTIGARALDTPVVAFCDDDSWWAPGALEQAARVFAAYPRLGLLAARVLVGDDEHLDPTCAAMAASPLVAGRLPGPGVLGFVACGAVVRRDAFLAVGGFDGRYGIGGEERRLAVDLATAGWDLAYVAGVIAHHHPGRAGPRPGRLRRQLRNDLWSAWLRRPARSALRETARLVGSTAEGHPVAAAAGVAAALRGARWVARERAVVPAAVERALRSIEAVG